MSRRRLSSGLRDLTHAEVMSWNVDQLEYQVSERQGPVEVFRSGVLIASFPFYAHWVMEGRGPKQGTLHVFDPIRRRHLREFAAGTWHEVGHGLHRGVLIG